MENAVGQNYFLSKKIAMLIIVIEVFFSVTSSAHGFSQIIFCLLLTVR